MDEQSSSGREPASRATAPDSGVDVDRIRSALEGHPVRLAVLFGSQVTDAVDAESDVDVAVEFEPDVDDPGKALLAVLADLSVELDRNDIDVAVVDDFTPRVGLAAFTHGQVIRGSLERAETHRERFEELVNDAETPKSLSERFDETLERVDRIVEPQ